jgi:hypothetical protein
MTRRNLARWFAGCLVAVTAPAAHAQMQDAFCEPAITHDMQLFAPVDFDFDCLPIRDDSGWFFNYNRLSWSISGERTIIGDPGRVDVAEEIVRQHALDDLPDPAEEGFAVPEPYTIINGIQDGGPEANFAWGDRYEFGYFKGANGWQVGVIDGPLVVTAKSYGFNQLLIPNTLPISQTFPGPGFGDPNFSQGFTFNDDSVQGDDGFNERFLSGSGDIPTTTNGFGSVHVNFETPEGYLLGWRDYHVNGADNDANATTGGPSFRVTALTRDVDGLITTISVSRGADGLIDNLDNDLINGFGVVLGDINGDGTIDDDEVVATFVDFDDLHRFNVRFDRLFTRNTTELQGFELMRTHELDNSYLPVKERRNRFAIGYGGRFFRIRDNFGWEGLGDMFGRSFTHTSAENQIVGPQIRAKWTHQRGRFGFDLDGRFTAGYNIQDLGQTGGIGEALNPGGLNSPLFAQPTYFDYGQSENFFSPLAEMRVEGSYQLTSAFALKLGYTATFVDNISRASQIVRYRLPDMGFREGEIGNQTIFVNGADFGLEAVF